MKPAPFFGTGFQLMRSFKNSRFLGTLSQSPCLIFSSNKENTFQHINKLKYWHTSKKHVNNWIFL